MWMALLSIVGKVQMFARKLPHHLQQIGTDLDGLLNFLAIGFRKLGQFLSPGLPLRLVSRGQISDVE